jgi:hypothetical protein
MTHYFRRRWDDTRGDEHTAWGCSEWLFETDDEFQPVRQIELYDGGQVLFYDQEHMEDEYGGLSYLALDPEEFEHFRTTPEAFAREWSMRKPLNRS